MLPEPLLRAVRRVALRVRAQRAAEAGTTAGLAGLGVAALALLAGKTGAIDDGEARVLLAIAGLTPIAAALFAALRPVPLLVAARMLDRTHATSGRIAAALELASQAAPGDGWARAALDDAGAHAGALRADRAAPLHAPRDLASFAGLALAVAALAVLEIPRRVLEPIARGITPVVLHDDDLDAYEARLRAITDAPDVAPEVLASAAELNRVLEDLADRRIDRQETLRRLAELEARIEAGRPAGDEHLRDELRAMGQELRRSGLATDLAEAMREADAARAEVAMRELAARMRDPERRPDRGELERLRRAMEEAARERESSGQDELERREEEMQRLLRQREAAGPSEREEQERLLEQRRRELDRLRREHQAQQEARRELDRLRRELEDAAEDLQQQDQQGAEQASQSMDRAAEDLNRMARQQLTREQQEDIARQARELRELLRRQREQEQQAGGEGGEGQQGQQGQGSQGSQGRAPSAMDRFVLRARGQGEGQGMPIAAPGAGQQGHGQSPGGGEQQGAQGGQGAGAEGQGGAEGGEGTGQEQEMLVLGQGGDAQLEIPGLGGTQGEEGGAGGAGEGTMPGGGAGSEHAPASLDDPTQLGGAGRTVQVRGEARRGPTRPEVIRTAAQRGFATREYRDVYAEYADHAEEVIERDRVPPGYRFYVQRYFQLIRPRGGSSESETE